MKKLIALSLILAIAACDDSSSDKKDVSDITIPATGLQTAPAITDGGAIVSQGTVELNKSYSDSISKGTEHTYTFTSPTNDGVVFKIEGATGDLDLSITNGATISSEGETSNEHVFYDPDKGSDYTIRVWSNSTDTTDDQFTLIVVTANVADLGLEDGEIILSRHNTGSRYCYGSSVTYTSATDWTDHIIVNYSKGYVIYPHDTLQHGVTNSPYDTTKYFFSSKSKNTFTAKTYRDGMMSITIDPESLAITGTLSTIVLGSDWRIVGRYVDCDHTGIITGKVLFSK